MGYTTRFQGDFTIVPPLNRHQRAEYGDRYRDGSTNEGPGGYCQWDLDADGGRLRWDGVEKFYDYEKWLQHLVDSFFTPIGCTVYGSVTWQGEDIADRGVLSVVNGKVLAVHDEDRKPAKDLQSRFDFLVGELRGKVIPWLKEQGEDGVLKVITDALKKCEAP